MTTIDLNDLINRMLVQITQINSDQHKNDVEEFKHALRTLDAARRTLATAIVTLETEHLV